MASCTLGSLGVSASRRLQSHPRKDPDLCFYPNFSAELWNGTSSCPWSPPREDPQVLRSSNRVPGLPGFIPHPPTPLFCPGEEPHPSSGIRKPSPALYLLSLSWLQLSLPGVLTTSEVPGRASAFILSHSQPSPLTLVFTPCHTPMWSAFSCALGAPLLGTHPGLSETLRHNLRLCWPSGPPCPLLASCAPTTLSGRRCLGSDPCPPEALRPPDPVLGLGEADTPTRILAL